MSATSTDRCEVCTRVIRTRPNPRKRRCAEHVHVAPLFPLAAVKKPGRPATEGGAR